MNESFVRELCQLNNRFYRTQAASFSETRHASWPGWDRCLSFLPQAMSSTHGFDPQHGSFCNAVCGPLYATVGDCSHAAALASSSSTTALVSPEAPCSLLDVACGNLRFEEHLLRTFPDADIRIDALDSCESLLPPELPRNTRFRCCDVIEALVSSTLDDALSSSGTYRFTVSFGFMHHIPGKDWRKRFLQTLVDSTEPGGTVCVSLWRFMDDESLAAKAQLTHQTGIEELGFDAAEFEPGDFLIGWKNEPGTYRYCHSFDDTETDALIAAVRKNAECLDRFRSDGRSGNLNEYLILRRTR